MLHEKPQVIWLYPRWKLLTDSQVNRNQFV